MTDTLVDGFRTSALVLKLAKKLKGFEFQRPLTLMHVCGSHENAIAKFGIRQLLPDNVRVIAGPGCPVCVCPVQDIEAAKKLALEKKAILVTFGDMMKTPTPYGSLSDARANGADIRIAYSPFDAIEIAARNPGVEVVFFAVGFETTACGVASMFKLPLPDNLTFLISHRLIPSALEALLETGEMKIKGMILPGHVSAVIGLTDYIPIVERFKLPSVAVGFEPIDLLSGLHTLIDNLTKGVVSCENAYTRAIRKTGNARAKEILNDVFDICDARWRGIGVIKASGLKLKKRYQEKDARTRFSLTSDDTLLEINQGCRCNEVMLGRINPDMCPLFANACTPENPHGPCMVSYEGSCKTFYRYR